MVNILGFVGCVASVAIIQPCHCSTKAAIDIIKMSGCGYVTIKLYLQTQAVGQIWLMEFSLPTHVLECSLWML